MAAGDIGIALIGSGRMGSFHGETVSRRLAGTRLAAAESAARGNPVRIDEVAK